MEWKKINEKYEINNEGVVRNIKSGRLLKYGWKGGNNTAGDNSYLTVRVRPRVSDYVHRLVAIAFIPNPENKTTVDHIDRNRRNNHISNLRWASRKEQSANRNCSPVHAESAEATISSNLETDEGRLLSLHQRIWYFVLVCFSTYAGLLFRVTTPQTQLNES